MLPNFIRRTALLFLLATFIGATTSLAQVPPEQAAEMLLTAARKAHNEGNYPFAQGKYQEYIQKHANQPGIGAARYGLALCYLDGPERNFEKAIELLPSVVGNANLPEQPYAQYYMGVAHRGQALTDLALAATKQGGEQQQLRDRANARMTEAAKHFTAATASFTARLPKGEIPKDLPKELDWAARSRCDQAEMELRLNKSKEARATAEPLTKDPLLLKSRFAPLGLYYFGYAAYLMQDYLVAGRSLNELSPFADPAYGLHARYLMGRIYQITEEGDKALAMYEKIAVDFDKQKKDAVEAMKRPEQFKTNLSEKLRLEALNKNPPPDYVTGALFYSASLLYEAGKFGEALSRFQAFAKDNPTSPLLFEAGLRSGYCQVQLKLFVEAIATLTPLIEKNPKLADQVLFWQGKAQAGVALALPVDPMNAPARDAGLKTAITTLRASAERAAQNIATDPDAKIRRAESFLEMADTQQHARLYKEAGAVYEQLLNEKSLPNRTEELHQRFITAMHLAGDFARCEQAADTFQKEFPRSPLLPLVLFRLAENSYFVALAAEKRTDLPNKDAELARLFGDAGNRYKTVIDKYPEFERIALARYGLAMCHFKRNEIEEARTAIETIPAPDRTGDLALAPYLLAECLIRQAPAKAEDALQAGMLQGKLSQAIQNLDGFIGAQPKAPEVPEAFLKLGVCQFRLAAMIAVPQERNNALTVARQTFEKLIQAFPKEVAGMQAVLERAKTMAAMGDKAGAMNELRKFTVDPLLASPAAPAAVVYLATLLREQNKAEEGSTLINLVRQRHDAALSKDNPERAALMRYHQGICLQEAGKFKEAVAVLETIVPLTAGKAMALEATLRSSQCKLADARKVVETARQQLAMPKLNPDQIGAANVLLQSGLNTMNEVAQLMFVRAEENRESLPNVDARARLYYEAAWSWRAYAEHEIATVRKQLQTDKRNQLQAEADSKAAPGTKAAPVPMPEIPLSAVPVQPGEQRTQQAYRTLIVEYPETLLSIEARFEQAELQAERGQHDAACKLLRTALDVEPNDNKIPSTELLDRIRIRLGACLMAKKEPKEALEKLLVVADNPKSTLVAQGQYRAAECLFALGEFDKAAARLVLFRDKPEFHNVPGVSDRAILRLGQSYIALKQWDPAQQAMLLLQQRYGNSVWINEARFSQGWALQNAGQFDPAVVAYNAVIANTASELAAKAHLQIGLCRLEQKRYGDAASALLVVPFTFDYPELSAAALTEAARAFIEDKKPEQAERLLQRVLKDHPKSDWAKIAQKRLEEMKK